MSDELQRDFTSVHASPPLGLVATVFVVLFVASIVANIVMTAGAPYPMPYLPIDKLQDHYLRFPAALRVTSFLQMGASIPLAIFVATAVSRLQFHRINVAGVHIALVGGMAASIFLGLSALSSWALSQPGVAADAGAMRVAQLLAFATGAFGHTATLGLLLAGISIPSLIFRLLPRWAAWWGIGVAVICELALLSMVFPTLSLLLPIGRFPAYIWLIVAGFKLPKRAHWQAERTDAGWHGRGSATTMTPAPAT
jgi:hypothetical protein